MELEPSPAPAVITKKMWKIARIVFLMVKKNISNIKVLILDLQMLAGKALSCRSGAVDPFLSFICTNTPLSKHKQQTQRRNRYRRGVDVQKAVLQMLNNISNNNNINNNDSDVSPTGLAGLGLGMKSPSTVTDDDEDAHVDKAAEDFIKKFYKELRHQNRLATLDSPSPCHVYVR